jgi:hypothetical protein
MAEFHSAADDDLLKATMDAVNSSASSLAQQQQSFDHDLAKMGSWLI